VSTTHTKGWCLADSGRPCRRTVQTWSEGSLQVPSDFRHPGERRAVAVAPVPDSCRVLRLQLGGRASRAVDESPRPCERLSSSARAEHTESRKPSLLRGRRRGESPHSTQTRASLGHRLRATGFGELPAATNQPKTRLMVRAPRRERACKRIEMLSIVHHSFARVRIAPRHARVEPARPSLREERG